MCVTHLSHLMCFSAILRAACAHSQCCIRTVYVLDLQHCTVHVYVICVCQMLCILKPVAVQMCPRDRESEGHMDKVTWAQHVLLLEAWWTGFTQQSSHCVCVSVCDCADKNSIVSALQCVLFVWLVSLLFVWQKGLRHYMSFCLILNLFLAWKWPNMIDVGCLEHRCIKNNYIPDAKMVLIQFSENCSALLVCAVVFLLLAPPATSSSAHRLYSVMTSEVLNHFSRLEKGLTNRKPPWIKHV